MDRILLLEDGTVFKAKRDLVLLIDIFGGSVFTNRMTGYKKLILTSIQWSNDRFFINLSIGNTRD